MSELALPATTTPDLPAAFARLFAGLERVHGRYLVPRAARADARGKVEGKPWTAKQAITAADWAAHLSGEQVTVPHGQETLTGTLGLGVTPIRDDDTCVFGAIDVDVYPLELARLTARVRELSLPLVVCRTKSGGAHCYLFMTEPAPAELVRTALMGWAILLGHPGVEVFPKQTHLASERDEGSWINLPYAGGGRSTRYALDPVSFQALTPEEFVSLADARAISASALAAFEPSLPPEDEQIEALFDGGPPCLRTLARSGFPPGSRNNALFGVAVYLKKRYGAEEFGPHLEAYNQRLMDPPKDAAEVSALIKSLTKKDYGYKCREAPVVSVCDRRVCLKCEFGVGGLPDDPGVVLGPLVKLRTDPPTWIWDVDGARIELTTAELTDQRAFGQKVIDGLNKWPSPIKPGAWQAIIRDRLATAEIVDVPDDATKRGQLWVHLERFCTSRVVGRSLDELLLGKPYTDPEKGRTFFCSSDFMDHLQRHRAGSITEKDLYKWLRERGVEHHFSVIKGKGVNHWSVPAFTGQTEAFDVPRVPPSEAM